MGAAISARVRGHGELQLQQRASREAAKSQGGSADWFAHEQSEQSHPRDGVLRAPSANRRAVPETGAATVGEVPAPRSPEGNEGCTAPRQTTTPNAPPGCAAKASCAVPVRAEVTESNKNAEPDRAKPPRPNKKKKRGKKGRIKRAAKQNHLPAAVPGSKLVAMEWRPWPGRVGRGGAPRPPAAQRPQPQAVAGGGGGGMCGSPGHWHRIWPAWSPCPRIRRGSLHYIMAGRPSWRVLLSE